MLPSQACRSLLRPLSTTSSHAVLAQQPDCAGLRPLVARFLGKRHVRADRKPVSALLFGLWHLPWALKALHYKSHASAAPITSQMLANFVPQALLGIVWSYLYIRTGNLWGPWAAHTLTNSAVNFVHVRSLAGIDTGLSIRMIIFTIMMLLGLIVMHRASHAYDLPTVAPWGR